MEYADLQTVALYYVVPACGIISLICAALILKSRTKARRLALANDIVDALRGDQSVEDFFAEAENFDRHEMG